MVANAEYAPDEHTKECAGLGRVAQQNRLACMVAERAMVAATQLEVSLEFTHHQSFPVAVLKSRKAP